MLKAEKHRILRVRDYFNIPKYIYENIIVIDCLLIYFIINRQLLELKFDFNKNTFLIEMYKIYLAKKLETHNDSPVNAAKDRLTFDDLAFLLSYSNGALINEDCITEFYFLLMAAEFDLAINLLQKHYSYKIRDYLNKLFIDEDSSLLKAILFSNELIMISIKAALERGLDGVAL